MAARTPRSHTRGHVFVVEADVTTIRCDAWLCPTDHYFNLEPWVRKGLGVKTRRLRDYSWGRRRAIPYDRAVTPLIVLGDVGQSQGSGADRVDARIKRLLPVIDDFAEVALEHITGRAPEVPPRLALPLIGTGKGGLRGVQGRTLRPLLFQLDKVARNAHVDFVLCTYTPLAWSAVQAARASQHWQLTLTEKELADELAKKAEADGLVLFIGAGASRDVNLPDWQQLLKHFRLDDLSRLERKTLRDIDLRDYATLIQTKVSRNALLSELKQFWAALICPSG